MSKMPMDDSNPSPRGSARSVAEFDSFCEGDTDPTLCKKIRILIECDKNYIVYIDDDLAVEWSLTEAYGEPSETYGEVANQIGYLETVSVGLLRKCQIEPFSRLLGEAMARIIGGGNIAKASEILEKAKKYLQARSIENARMWYIFTACTCTTLLVIIAIVIWVCHSTVKHTIGNNPFDVLLGSLLGGVGALFSVLSRTKDIKVDAAAGWPIHCLESAARIGTGSIGAIVIALAIKGNILLGIIRSADHSLSALLAICIISGISERIVPSFIKQVEGSISAYRPTKAGST
jgi:hypothetical protein